MPGWVWFLVSVDRFLARHRVASPTPGHLRAHRDPRRVASRRTPLPLRGIHDPTHPASPERNHRDQHQTGGDRHRHDPHGIVQPRCTNRKASRGRVTPLAGTQSTSRPLTVTVTVSPRSARRTRSHTHSSPASNSATCSRKRPGSPGDEKTPASSTTALSSASLHRPGSP